MSEDFEREERAFAEALHASVPVESFRPLDPEAIRAAARPAESTRRRGWLKGLAAAAAIVAAVGIGAALLPRLAGSSGASAAASTASDGYAAGGAAPEAAPADKSGQTVTTGDAASTPGFRWESYRNVQVEVPESWGYASAPRSDFCIAETFPREPYVDVNRGGEAVAAIGCGESLRDDQQALHLSFTAADSAAPWAAPSRKWKQHTRILGEARITVVATAADTGLADQILSSAMIVPNAKSPAGCPVQQPAVPAVELAGLDASELTVCQYERAESRGAFRASVVLSGTEATTAWAALLAAPEGGGPDMSASTCGDAKGWPLLLLVGTEQVPVAGSVAGCAQNGIADASARDGMRAITRDLCQALVVDPVRISEGSGASAGLCMR